MEIGVSPSGFLETASYLTGSREGKVWRYRLNFLSQGRPTRVEFDWAVVIKREEKYGDVTGFYHTHPFGLTRPSRRDIKTMKAWCDCLGKPLLCAIGIPKPDSIEILGYLFRNHRSLGRKVRLVGQDTGQIVFKE